MSIFLCRAVVTRSYIENTAPKTEMQSEMDMIEATSAELARQHRHQRIARLAAPVTSAWTRTFDRLTRPSREAQQRKDLLERLENMPAYMLSDIGVTRDTVGRYCHYNDFGMLVELAPAGQNAPAAPAEARIEGRLPEYAAQ